MRKTLRNILTAGAALVIAFSAGYWQSASLVTGCRQEDLAQITDVSFAPLEQRVSAGDGKSNEKRVCLTFDDGPSKNTLAVLGILAEEQVPATFFVIGADNNQEYLPLVQQEVEQGHQVGLHSACHQYKKIYASADAYWQDIEMLKQELSAYIDVSSIDCLRFPGGSTNTVSHRYGGSQIMKELREEAQARGYHVVDWNVCADDAVGGHPSSKKVFQNTIEDVEDKSTCIVLMHDTNATASTVEALPDIIGWFRQKGYTFCTVDALYQQDDESKAA